MKTLMIPLTNFENLNIASKLQGINLLCMNQTLWNLEKMKMGLLFMEIVIIVFKNVTMKEIMIKKTIFIIVIIKTTEFKTM